MNTDTFSGTEVKECKKKVKEIKTRTKKGKMRGQGDIFSRTAGQAGRGQPGLCSGFWCW